MCIIYFLFIQRVHKNSTLCIKGVKSQIIPADEFSAQVSEANRGQ